MRHHGGGSKRPDEILAEIDRTRGEMDRTLSAIEQRLTPGQLVDQGMDYLRHSGANEFVQNLGGTAKQNPVPVALVGIGLAWLMALGRQPAQGNGASESSSSMRDRAGEMTGNVTETARQQFDRARGGMDYLVQEQPLALGAIGLAIGALLGAAAPRTQAEERAMGAASRNLAEKAKAQAQPKAQTPRPQSQPQPARKYPGDGEDKMGGW